MGYVFNRHFQGQTFEITLYRYNSKNVCTQINKFAIVQASWQNNFQLEYEYLFTFV